MVSKGVKFDLTSLSPGSSERGSITASKGDLIVL